ncbi:MAG: LysR family transcriptional regulator [Steroidobacteraceae bacterium]
MPHIADVSDANFPPSQALAQLPARASLLYDQTKIEWHRFGWTALFAQGRHALLQNLNQFCVSLRQVANRARFIITYHKNHYRRTQRLMARAPRKPNPVIRLNRLDLNLLVALDALLQERNVTRAAERVFISQPAMSNALRRLREYLDDPLLVRAGRDLQLTPRGLALVEPMREALLRVHMVLGTQPTFDAGTVRRTFAEMIPDFVVPWLMPELLRRVYTTAPSVRIQLENWSSSGPSRLIHGELDFFVTLDTSRLLGLSSFPDCLCSTQLRPIRWVCAVSNDHPDVRDELTKERFLALPHVYVRLPGDTLSIDELVRRQLGIRLDVRATTESVLEVPFLLPGTRLVAIIPETLGVQLANALSIKVLEIPPGFLPKRKVTLLWHRRSEPDPAHAWMRSLITEVSQSPIAA